MEMPTLKQLIRSYFKPYKHYSNEKELLGTYIFYNDWNYVGAGLPFEDGIKYMPEKGTFIKDAIKESIKIQDQYKMNVYMNFGGIIIKVPYKTQSDEKTIQSIIDEFHKNWQAWISAHQNCVRS